MVRERIEAALPRGISWRTFKNYRSMLVRLGLIELVHRAKNQYDRLSRWRFRFDRVVCLDGVTRHVSEIPSHQLPFGDLDSMSAQGMAADKAPERALAAEIQAGNSQGAVVIENASTDESDEVRSGGVGSKLWQLVSQESSRPAPEKSPYSALHERCERCLARNIAEPNVNKSELDISELRGSQAFSSEPQPIRTRPRSPPDGSEGQIGSQSPRNASDLPVSRAQKRRLQRASSKSRFGAKRKGSDKGRERGDGDSEFIAICRHAFIHLVDMPNAEREADRLREFEQIWDKRAPGWPVSEAFILAMTRLEAMQKSGASPPTDSTVKSMILLMRELLDDRPPAEDERQALSAQWRQWVQEVSDTFVEPAIMDVSKVSDSAFISRSKGRMKDYFDAHFREADIVNLRKIEDEWVGRRLDWSIDDAFDAALLRSVTAIEDGKEVKNFGAYTVGVLRNLMVEGRPGKSPEPHDIRSYKTRMGVRVSRY